MKCAHIHAYDIHYLHDFALHHMTFHFLRRSHFDSTSLVNVGRSYVSCVKSHRPDMSFKYSFQFCFSDFGFQGHIIISITNAISQTCGGHAMTPQADSEVCIAHCSFGWVMTQTSPSIFTCSSASLTGHAVLTVNLICPVALYVTSMK